MSSPLEIMPSNGSSPARDKQNARSQPPADPSMLLGAFREDINDIRSLIQCGVCVKLLYEPFTLACGHTFCYSCLTQWFTSSRRNKTCPDCRASVKAQPAPAYLVREIVQMFTNREELVEDYESAADHTTCRLAETERMEVDKSNTDPREGGLFGGCFNKIAPPGDPIYDIDDGVERCPACAWELEDGECVHCGGFGENDEFDMDGIGDFDEADEFSDSVSRDTEMRRRVFRQMANALRPPVPGARNNDPLRRQFDRILNNPHRDTDDSSSNDSSSDGSSSDGSSSDDSSSDDSSSEDESDGGEMASFIIDDEGLEEDHGPDHSTMMEEHSFMPDEMDQTLEMNPSMPHNPESPIEVEDSAEEVETSLRRPEWRSRALQIPPSSPDFLSRSSGLYGSSGSSGLEDDNDASSNEDEGSVAPSGAGSAGTSTTNPIAIDDDGDGDDGDDDDDDDDEDEGPIRPSRANRIRERRERRQANRRIRRSGERRRL